MEVHLFKLIRAELIYLKDIYLDLYFTRKAILLTKLSSQKRRIQTWYELMFAPEMSVMPTIIY